jgi:hypothetical protein
MKTKFLFLGLLMALVTVSCSKDKEDQLNNAITAEEAIINAKIDSASDDVLDIVEDQFNATMDDTTWGKTESNINSASLLPNCATVVRNPVVGTPLTPGQTVTKTIEFISTGCTLNNGNILKGKIIISFVFQPNATSHTITYTFENFYHNLIKYDGTKTFTRTLTLGSNAHPIVVMTMQMSITLVDGRVINRVGTRTREIVEGYNTPLNWHDNVYQITGNWTTTFPNTTIQNSTITSPLLVKMSCASITQPLPLLTQGIITFERNTHTATLDYGNGTCDNQAVFTINGISYPITIGN